LGFLYAKVFGGNFRGSIRKIIKFIIGKFHMKKKVLLSASLLLVAAINVAHAADLTDDQGTVTFTGTIINPPCQVDTDSEDVQVPFTPLGTNAFAGIGEEASQVQPFAIKLTKCPANTVVNLTFAGDTATENTQLKALTGGVDTGVGIVVYGADASNDKVVFNDEANSAFAQTTGASEENDLTFNFTSKVVATVDPASIKGGEFAATTTYTIYYP